jgi:hypothetical protein
MMLCLMTKYHHRIWLREAIIMIPVENDSANLTRQGVFNMIVADATQEFDEAATLSPEELELTR